MTDEVMFRPGDGWNEVREAGMAYLAAAEAMYSIQAQKVGFMAIHEWYVVHHLSVIAAEILTKSFKVTYKNVEWSEDGPLNYGVEHAYGSHHFQSGKIHEVDFQRLREHLTPEQLRLLYSISDDEAARREIARGRYPYESRRGPSFPSGEKGRLEAEKWLDLARALSKFGVEHHENKSA